MVFLWEEAKFYNLLASQNFEFFFYQTKQQNMKQISANTSLVWRSFFSRHFAGRLVVALRYVGC